MPPDSSLQLPQNNTFELIVVGVYFCFLIGIGVVFGRLVRNSQDYFKAGGQANWWLVGASMFMSGISTYTFVGNASGIFKSGWSPLAIYIANVLALGTCALFMAAWYRQMRVITVAEVIRVRFGKVSESVLASLMVVNALIWSGAVLYGLAVFFEMLLPEVPQWALILAVGAIVIGYCTIGGNWAVIANDFVQGLVMVSVVVLITVLCFREAGGVGAFFNAISNSPDAAELSFVTPSKPGDTFMTAQYGISWLFVTFLVQFMNTVSLFQGTRYFSAKDGREAAKASMLGAGLMVVGCLVFFVPPIFSRLFLFDEVMAMHPDPMKAPEYSFAAASRFLLSRGPFSLMLVAMLAAAISSLDTGLNRNAAIVVRNLIPALQRAFKLPPLPESKEVMVGKSVTVVLGLIIITLAISFSKLKGITLFDLMLSIGNMLMLPQYIPLVLFLFIRKVPGWSALAALFAGFLPSLINMIFDLGWSYQILSAAIVTSSASVFILSKFFYGSVPAEEKARHAAFYRNLETPVNYAKEVGVSSDSFQFRQIGRFAVGLGLMTQLLLIGEDTAQGRLSILAIGSAVTLIGAGMLWAAKRLDRRAASPR